MYQNTTTISGNWFRSHCSKSLSCMSMSWVDSPQLCAVVDDATSGGNRKCGNLFESNIEEDVWQREINFFRKGTCYRQYIISMSLIRLDVASGDDNGSSWASAGPAISWSNVHACTLHTDYVSLLANPIGRKNAEMQRVLRDCFSILLALRVEISGERYRNNRPILNRSLRCGELCEVLVTFGKTAAWDLVRHDAFKNWNEASTSTADPANRYNFFN